MTGKHISNEKKQEIADLLSEGLTIAAVEAKTGCAFSTIRKIRDQLKIPPKSKNWREHVPAFVPVLHKQNFDAHGSLRGESVTTKPPPGPKYEVPEGLAIERQSTYTNGEGYIIGQWNVASKEKTDPAELARMVREVFSEAVPLPSIATPTRCLPGHFTAYPVPDLHMGMRADLDDTGNAYDYDIAEDRVSNAIDRLVALTPASRTALLVFMGDNTHTNDSTNMTPRSGHVMDTVSRHRTTQKRGLRLGRRMIERVAAKHERVFVRVLRGNHDPDASDALELALSCVYEESDRIHVYEDGRPIFYFRQGASFVAFHHGHETPPDRMPLTMAEDCPDDWAKSEFRYCFHGHFHKKVKGTLGSVEIEGLPPVCARDAYGHGIGGRSKPSLSALSFCEMDGLVARNIEPLRYPSAPVVAALT